MLTDWRKKQDSNPHYPLRLRRFQGAVLHQWPFFQCLTLYALRLDESADSWWVRLPGVYAPQRKTRGSNPQHTYVYDTFPRCLLTIRLSSKEPACGCHPFPTFTQQYYFSRAMAPGAVAGSAEETGVEPARPLRATMFRISRRRHLSAGSSKRSGREIIAGGCFVFRGRKEVTQCYAST